MKIEVIDRATDPSREKFYYYVSDDDDPLHVEITQVLNKDMPQNAESITISKESVPKLIKALERVAKHDAGKD